MLAYFPSVNIRFMICLQDYLKEEFEIRRGKNSQYSLRAFARDLKIGISTLSKLFSGKAQPSLSLQKTIVSGLNIEPQTLQKIFSSHPEYYKEINFTELTKLPHSLILQDCLIEIISHQTLTASEISSYLETDPIIIGEIIDQLLDVRMIEETDQGYRAVSVNTTSIIDDQLTTDELKQYQKDLLKISANSINQTTIEKRNHTSLIFALDEEQINEIKEEITTFRRRINKIAHQSNKNSKSNLYAMQMSLFPMTFNKEDN